MRFKLLRRARFLLLLFIAAAPLTAYAQHDLRLQTFRDYDPVSGYRFEAPQLQVSDYDGLTLYLGAAFTQQFQALTQSNEADLDPNGDGLNENELVDIGPGFNLATANLYVGALLTPGVRVNLTTYLSSRHHSETWVKGGYLLVDEMPFFHSAAIDNLMRYLTIKAGHFEINYGDAHFRRTDNGNAIMNPFVGNYIMDAFTTEIGGEVYFRNKGALAMVGVTNGEIHGGVTNPDGRAPSFYGKIGFDKMLQPDVRVRLTGSAYTTVKSDNNTLYGGDRAGARYYSIFETAYAAPFTAPRMDPNFRDDNTAFQINPFVQFQGLELFGVYEHATGSLAAEPNNRSVNQFAVDAVYRFLESRQAYVGGRYNLVKGELMPFSDAEVSTHRFEVGAGWFITPNVLTKVSYVQQQYNDYPVSSIYHNAEFGGLMIEGVVAF